MEARSKRGPESTRGAVPSYEEAQRRPGRASGHVYGFILTGRTDRLRDLALAEQVPAEHCVQAGADHAAEEVAEAALGKDSDGQRPGEQWRRGEKQADVLLSTRGGVLSTTAVRLVRPARFVGLGFVPFRFPGFRFASEGTDDKRQQQNLTKHAN